MIGQKPDGMIRIKISSRESRDGPATSSFGRIKHYREPKTQLKTHYQKTHKISEKIRNFKNQERNSKFKVIHKFIIDLSGPRN